jgi:hypothetical protein
MKALLGIFAFCLLTANGMLAATYTTNFPAAENPLSESGHWVNGGKDGIDWTDCRSTVGFGFGTQIGNVSYNDSVCQLTGSWGADQTAQGTVKIQATDNTTYEEAEVLLHFTISAHSATGYEINCSLKSGHPYIAITRWNGPFGNFTQLTVNNTVHCSNGDVLKATMTGKTISAYKNGVLEVTASDSTFTGGSPGMGFSLGGGTGTVGNFGFSSYTAMDTAGANGGGNGSGPAPPTDLTAVVH